MATVIVLQGCKHVPTLVEPNIPGIQSYSLNDDRITMVSGNGFHFLVKTLLIEDNAEIPKVEREQQVRQISLASGEQAKVRHVQLSSVFY